MIDRVQFSAVIRPQADRIEVAFTVVNRRDEPIYLIDVAFQAVPNGVAVRPDHLLVTFEPPDTAVLASKLLPPDPKVAWATPPVAYGTRVGPGDKYENKVGAPLPLWPTTFPPRPRPTGPAAANHRVVVCRTVRFELGCVLHAAELQAQLQVLAGRPVYQFPAAVGHRHEVLLTAEDRQVQLPLWPHQ